MVLVTEGDRADGTLDGIVVDLDAAVVHEIEVPLSYSIERDLGELVFSIEHKRPPFPDGHWGRATTQVCLAMLESSRLHAEIELSGR
jgi:hypothetical protein